MPKTLLLNNLKNDASYIIDIIDGNSVIPRSDLAKTLAIERLLERMLGIIKRFKEE